MSHFSVLFSLTFLRTAGICCLLSIFVGCSDSADDQPDLGLVTGTITLDGQPVDAAIVTFRPQKGRPSSGTTDAAGKYELFYIRDTTGAAIGTHQVSISKMIDKGINQSKSGAKPTPEDLQSGNQQETIAKKYNTNSTLTADVKQGTNEVDFKLTSK